jgi:hypothetical protein
MAIRPNSVFRTSPLTVSVALLALASAAWAASTVTSPGVVASSEGNSDNLYPFNSAPMRYQQVIAASEFSGTAGWINQIRLRPDGINGSAFSETLRNIQINLSTTTKSPSTLSKTFSQNIGNNDTVVFSGSLVLSSAFTGAAGGPMDFDIVITLQTPFYYDSTAGALLFDVRDYSGGTTTQFDAQDAPDSTARVWSLDVNATTANSTDPYPSAGLVLQFIFQ